MEYELSVLVGARRVLQERVAPQWLRSSSEVWPSEWLSVLRFVTSSGQLVRFELKRLPSRAQRFSGSSVRSSKRSSAAG